MNIIDAIIIIFIIFALVRGIYKGFIMEFATLVALLLGIIGAILFSGIVENWLSGFLSTRFISVVSFIILFVGIALAVNLTAKIIDHFVKAIALGWLNRIAGGVFAVLKFMFFISIIILTLDFFGLGTKILPNEKRENSFLFTPVERFAPAVLDLFKLDYEFMMREKDGKNEDDKFCENNFIVFLFSPAGEE